jgi:hypothetical protein
MIFKVFNILYDTDGFTHDQEGAEIDLPKELFLNTDDCPEATKSELSDIISDKTGYCPDVFEFEAVQSTFSFGECPEDLIKKACNSQCPMGYTMTIKAQDEWSWLAAAVNTGIDAHLEALTNRSTFDNSTGVCNVHPNELHVLLRRLLDQGWDQTEDQIEGRAESPHGLRSAILDTLGIEEI